MKGLRLSFFLFCVDVKCLGRLKIVGICFTKLCLLDLALRLKLANSRWIFRIYILLLASACFEQI